MASSIRLVLASGSPARLDTLRAAGLPPVVMVSDADESPEPGENAAQLVCRLAELKARLVAARLNRERASQTTVVVGCDSVLELDGQAYGKPQTPDVATERWRRMRGRSGILHTGHHGALRRRLRRRDRGLRGDR